MSATGDLNLAAGALGALIGYIGAEVAHKKALERLLWPQRFYNQVTPASLLQAAVLLPTGGPLHKAAFEALEVLHNKGLFDGKQQGHMLGTIFYSDLELRYRQHCSGAGDGVREKARNCLWVSVLRRAKVYLPTKLPDGRKEVDVENGGELRTLLTRRTTQRVQHLKLTGLDGSKALTSNLRVFSEADRGLPTLVLIFASEISAIICAALVAALEHSYWFACIFVVPLALKLCAMLCSVRREYGLPALPADKTKQKKSTRSVCLEIFDYDHGFPVIEGPEELVCQFCRHWGHPIRSSTGDRYREIGSITVVVAFGLLFPAGLVSMLWAGKHAQIIWLSYQTYIILAMTLNRILRLDDVGCLEDLMARQLAKEEPVVLKGSNELFVQAQLESHIVGRVTDGLQKVSEITSRCGIVTNTVRHTSPASQAPKTT